MTTAALDEIRERFARDRFATEKGAVIDAVEHHYARVSMPVTEHLMNAYGAVMGGAVFTLADFAFAVASNWDQTPRVSLSTQITYLASPKGQLLTAEARAVKEGRSTCFYTVEVKDNTGRDIAHATINGFVMG